VPAFGGNRGGKARKDGLVPGSARAAEADRAKERERKRIAREDAARLAQPPPLPSATAPGEAATAPVAGAAEPGAVRLVAAPVLPWQPETLKNLFEQLLEAAEEGRVAAFLGKCAEAKLTAELVREIKADAHFPKAAKVLLADALPRLAAKWLNRSGMSAEYQDEISCLTAMVLIVQHDRGISSKLDELIAAAKKPVEPEKKTG
jgi:hypothetical protein